MYLCVLGFVCYYTVGQEDLVCWVLWSLLDWVHLVLCLFCGCRAKQHYI